MIFSMTIDLHLILTDIYVYVRTYVCMYVRKYYMDAPYTYIRSSNFFMLCFGVLLNRFGNVRNYTLFIHFAY